ncbi:hypothetical protein [Pseudomonas aeruginosa]|uniref:hypothetical protein n=1 Tax=Pseudomonas aeruginosa TaxID=287 RepID=UPI001D18F3A3|nr:hypothetical protein [Pseudomonas aeruginosa]MCC4281539.1 hypothetical protein [Pseudomonas aeruginosa]MEC4070397.1 hypothetical protein [Pseudomonas aeruginosa]HBO2700939.1 hypothetical protein [Pseudomonas aeruginosa]HEP9710546.1 hypothetical protein [Pseudomonas aeruginosa]
MKSLPFHGIILLEKSERLQHIDGTAHIALCAMAVEAFLEDLKAYYQAISKSRPYTPKSSLFNLNPEPRYFGGGAMINGRMEYVESSERELEQLIDRNEKERARLTDKYETVISHLNADWKKGEDESFKNFKRLVQLRNNLIHIKSDEIELDEDNYVSEHPKVLKELQRLGIVGDERSAISWVFMLDTEKVVRWARDTAIGIMREILEIIPSTPVSNSFKTSYTSDLKTFKFK